MLSLKNDLQYSADIRLVCVCSLSDLSTGPAVSNAASYLGARDLYEQMSVIMKSDLNSTPSTGARACEGSPVV